MALNMPLRVLQETERTREEPILPVMPAIPRSHEDLSNTPLIHRFLRHGERAYYNAFTHRILRRGVGEPEPQRCELEELSQIDWEFLPFEDLGAPHLMRVEVTQECNFRCKYCLVFENNLHQLNSSMSVATAERLVQFYHEKMNGGTLMLMGGEPTLNWPVCRVFLDNLPVEAPKELYTNGILLSDDRIEYLRERNVSIRMSIDGFARHHRQRTNLAGETLYETVLERFRAIRDRGCSIGINCTVTHENLPDLIEIHNFFVEELGARMFGYSIPHYAVHSEMTENLDMHQYTATMLKIYESAKRNRLYVHQLIKRLAYLVRGRFKAIGCTVVGPEVTFYPDGRQTLCTKLDSHSHTASVTTREIYEHLPYFMEDCRRCPAIGVCGGGCYWDAKMRFNRYQDLRECEFQQTLIERMVWDVLDWKEQYGDGYPTCLNDIFGVKMFA